MLELLLAQLPSGLATIDIVGADEQWTQRVEYPFVQRTKTQKLPCSTKATKATTVGAGPRAAPTIPQIVRYIDELYDIYNDSMKQEAITKFVEGVKRFIGENPGLALVGKKASREIMDFLARSSDKPPDAFFKLCSFLLNAKIAANGRTYEWSGITLTRDIHVKN